MDASIFNHLRGRSLLGNGLFGFFRPIRGSRLEGFLTRVPLRSTLGFSSDAASRLGDSSGFRFSGSKALARISHRLTVEARDRPAITSLHLLAVLNVLSRTPPFVKRRAPPTDAPLTHFASPRGEKSGLGEQY